MAPRQFDTIEYVLMYQTCQQRGKGVKNPLNLVNVVYGLPLLVGWNSWLNVKRHISLNVPANLPEMIGNPLMRLEFAANLKKARFYSI